MGAASKAAGDAIVLLGETRDELGGSEYLKVHARGHRRRAARRRFASREGASAAVSIERTREGLLRSAHDCAEGGLAVTLAECAFGTGGVGLTVDLTPVDASAAWTSVATLFSESASRVVVSVGTRARRRMCWSAPEALGVPAREIGTTGTGRINVSINGQSAIDIAVSEAESIWDSALGKYFKQRAA